MPGTVCSHIARQSLPMSGRFPSINYEDCEKTRSNRVTHSGCSKFIPAEPITAQLIPLQPYSPYRPAGIAASFSVQPQAFVKYWHTMPGR